MLTVIARSILNKVENIIHKFSQMNFCMNDIGYNMIE